MEHSAYMKLYKHPKWQMKRLEVLNYYGTECSSCGDTEKTLHVHHRRYERGKKPWEYEIDNFNVLCETCHEFYHRDKRELQRQIARLSPCQYREVCGYIKALKAIDEFDEDETVNLSDAEELEGAAKYLGIRCSGQILNLTHQSSGQIPSLTLESIEADTTVLQVKLMSFQDEIVKKAFDKFSETKG